MRLPQDLPNFSALWKIKSLVIFTGDFDIINLTLTIGVKGHFKLDFIRSIDWCADNLEKRSGDTF